MSWEETLLDASYRGVTLQVKNENLQAQRALSSHGVPYRDGDDVEDLGRAARRFAMNVVMFGINYEIELQNLLEALDTAGPGALIHPIYGRLDVVAQDWTVQHDAERPDYAEVSLNFLERTPGNPFFERQFEFVDVGVLDGDTGPTWQDGLLDLFGQLDVLVATVQQWIGGGWVGLLENILGLPGIGLRLAQLRTQIGGILSGVLGMLRPGSGNSSAASFDPLLDIPRTPVEIRSAISAAVAPEGSEPLVLARSLLALDNLPSVMPGGSTLDAQAARTASAFILAARQGLEVPAASVDAVPENLLEPALAATDPVRASAWGLVVLVMTELALAQASAVALILDAERSEPTLSPAELELLVGSARGLAQAAIVLHRRLYGVEQALRVIEPLRAVAGLIQETARQVVLQRPPLVNREVESAACLRLLAHRWYGDHSRSAELLRLNPQLRTPYSVQAGEVLRVYAK
ncbi:Mu-like prophage DNA circulation protein [Pseudomonas flavescens]|uniref:Mu-like prophage DNA circulation protein n=1 Tax=Phytopseudomonas flavescens TaxID=29435 RepID=A0A1G8FHG8_9GAMM|nr:DNA circularization N-terminal domain-containing protein [Pseudomonas flavescens]SDH81439.1 Mu-like prophage DNA circulation protein [Pseudomonas flavescens]